MARILYLDDEEALVFLITRMLDFLGHKATGYTVASDAIASFANEPDSFDLVLTDLAMPGTSGLDFAERILEIRPEAAVAIVTGYVEMSDVEAAKLLGMLAVVAKPNSIEEMGRTVSELLAMKAAR